MTSPVPGYDSGKPIPLIPGLNKGTPIPIGKNPPKPKPPKYRPIKKTKEVNSIYNTY